MYAMPDMSCCWQKAPKKWGLTMSLCTGCRPGGLKKDPPSEVGNLITSREDTLFGLPTQPGKDISRDTVCAETLPCQISVNRASDKQEYCQ